MRARRRRLLPPRQDLSSAEEDPFSGATEEHGCYAHTCVQSDVCTSCKRAVYTSLTCEARTRLAGAYSTITQYEYILIFRLRRRRVTHRSDVLVLRSYNAVQGIKRLIPTAGFRRNFGNLYWPPRVLYGNRNVPKQSVCPKKRRLFWKSIGQPDVRRSWVPFQCRIDAWSGENSGASIR